MFLGEGIQQDIWRGHSAFNVGTGILVNMTLGEDIDVDVTLAVACACRHGPCCSSLYIAPT